MYLWYFFYFICPPPKGRGVAHTRLCARVPHIFWLLIIIIITYSMYTVWSNSECHGFTQYIINGLFFNHTPHPTHRRPDYIHILVCMLCYAPHPRSWHVRSALYTTVLSTQPFCGGEPDHGVTFCHHNHTAEVEYNTRAVLFT